jgi:hypothetical protein
MKKISILISIITISLSLLFPSCIAFAKDIKGDGKLITKSINISDFSTVEIETYVKINYSQEKNTGKLEFTVDQNLWDYYEIYTKENVLNIKLKKEYKNNINLKPTKCVITVSSAQLEEIDMAGSSIFNFCTPFTSAELSINLAGSGQVMAHQYPVNIKECDVEIGGSGSAQFAGTIDHAKIEIAGSGNAQFAGTIHQAKVEIAGSGKVKALDCKIANLNVEIAGSGNVEAHVTDKLDVEIAGSGNVKFKGNPTVTTDIAGSGKVVRL